MTLNRKPKQQWISSGSKKLVIHIWEFFHSRRIDLVFYLTTVISLLKIFLRLMTFQWKTSINYSNNLETFTASGWDLPMKGNLLDTRLWDTKTRLIHWSQGILEKLILKDQSFVYKNMTRHKDQLKVRQITICMSRTSNRVQLRKILGTYFNNSERLVVLLWEMAKLGRWHLYATKIQSMLLKQCKH